MDIISSSMMKKTLNYAKDTLGISRAVLLESAGRGAFEALKGEIYNSYSIICSTNDIGIIGLILAKYLTTNDKFVYINVIGDIDNASVDFKANLNTIKKLGVNVRLFKNSTVDLDILKAQIQRVDATVDAIYGFDLKYEIDDFITRVIDTLNLFKKKIISIDVPSGLESDNGFELGKCVVADKTITFHKNKNGLINRSDLSGKVDVVTLGLPLEID